jgi:hypothetical protein
MPVTWELRGLVLVVTLSGEYALTEGKQAVAEALADPAFRPGTTLLIDARRSLANPPAEEVRERAEWLASLTARGFAPRCAIVTSPEPFRYGLSRMLSTYADHAGLEIGLFASVEEATEWLGQS